MTAADVDSADTGEEGAENAKQKLNAKAQRFLTHRHNGSKTQRNVKDKDMVSSLWINEDVDLS